VVRALRYTASASGALLFWACASRACLADGAKITGGIEPAYTECLSAGTTCNNLVRTQFRIQYKPVSIRGFSVRLRLLRAYQMTMLNDGDDGSSEEEKSSKFEPPFDLADVKLRFSAPDGRDHYEIRTGYAYQASDPSKVDGYHTYYLSGDYYFGPPIPSGWGGKSRRFDFLVRVARNWYATASRPPETLEQFMPTYTMPVNATGSSRIYFTYARELRISGSTAVRTPSNRLELGAYRDPTRWIEFYGRLVFWGTRGITGTTKLLVGADITI
jgi:hypothetical protein